MHHDWPLRFKFTKKGVVHAGRLYGSRKHDRFYHNHNGEPPKMFIACTSFTKTILWSMKDKSRITSVPADTTITCKNCLREMGDRKEISERFAIMDKDGLYLRNRVSRTGEVADAKLFKVKGAAINWITERVYLNGKDEEINLGTWLELGRNNMPRRSVKRLIGGYRIFKTTMQLGEEVKVEAIHEKGR